MWRISEKKTPKSWCFIWVSAGWGTMQECLVLLLVLKEVHQRSSTVCVGLRKKGKYPFVWILSHSYCGESALWSQECFWIHALLTKQWLLGNIGIRSTLVWAPRCRDPVTKNPGSGPDFFFLSKEMLSVVDVPNSAAATLYLLDDLVRFSRRLVKRFCEIIRWLLWESKAPLSCLVHCLMGRLNPQTFWIMRSLSNWTVDRDA